MLRADSNPTPRTHIINRPPFCLATAEIEVVDFGATGIVRCKRCRTYINPYVTWADNGRRWR
jgi:protein transport protein SEC24